MKIERISNKIVCDNVGCGKLASHKVTMKTGFSFFICEDCLKEAVSCLGDFTNEKK